MQPFTEEPGSDGSMNESSIKYPSPDRQPDTRKTSPSSTLNRRRLLKGIGTCTAAIGGITRGAVTVGSAQESAGSVTLEDQSSDGNSIVVAEITMPEDGEVIVQDKTDGENTFFARFEMAEGTYEDYVVELDQSIEESQTIQVWAFDGPLAEEGSETVDIGSAFVRVGEDANLDVLGVTYVEADPDSGFNYPYYLFTPSGGDDRDVPLLVEPNNTGTSTDDFEQHRSRAKRLVENGMSRTISEALDVPLLVPVFPRPRSDPVDWTHYVHALDDTTMAIDDGPLERVDLQLLRMVSHAKSEVLSDTAYSFSDQLMLNGFSASGNFVDRFAVLHPDRVLSVTAGGLNGMPLLPLEEADGHTLNFHVGIADVEELTGEPVDLDVLDGVNQFLYMGADDDNDTIPYDDAWTDDDLRQTALDVYGEDMVDERFPRSQEAYREAGVEAQFRVYEDAGHTPRPAQDDIVAFHSRSLQGEDVGEFGQDLIAVPRVEVTSKTSVAGESMEFDAGDSAGGTGEITNYLWDFGDGATAVGETVSHSYDEPGEHTVTMTIVLDSGVERETTTKVSVAAADESPTGSEATNTEETSPTIDEPSSTGDDEPTFADGPGFGIASSLASLGGLGYLLERRLGDDKS